MAVSYGAGYLAALGVKPKPIAPKPIAALKGGTIFGNAQPATTNIYSATTPITPYTPPATVYNTTSSFVPAPAPQGGEGAGAPAPPPETTYNPPAPAAAPAYTAPKINIDLSGIWETAGQMADNEINPQLSEIDRLLQEAGYSADESQRAINEAYPVARRSLQKSIYENMVAGEGSLAAMGTGRGGGRQELLARAGTNEATGLEAIETGKQRETGAIERVLASYKEQLGTQRTSLQGQRGAKQATYAEQLRGNRFNEAATQANYGLNQAQLAENARQFNANLAQNESQFNATLAANTPSTSNGSATGYAGNNGTGGFTIPFLNDQDLRDLGLISTVQGVAGAGLKSTLNTGGWAGNVYTSNQVNTIQAGKPKTINTGRWAPYGYYGF